jgi:hypothetical protein
VGDLPCQTSQEGIDVPGRLTIACGLALLLAALAACAGPPAEPWSDEDLGVQPVTSWAPDAGDRTLASLLGPEPPVVGLVAKNPEAQWTDDVVSRVCNTLEGDGIYSSYSGRARLWTSPDLTVQSFVGAFGAVPAATAVEQVKSRFTCAEYTADVDTDGRGIPNQDADGWHRNIRRLGPPPPLDGVENAVLFCETVKEVNQRCYAALARRDIVSRVTVTAVTTERAEHVIRSLLDESAARLIAATP